MVGVARERTMEGSAEPLATVTVGTRVRRLAADDDAKPAPVDRWGRTPHALAKATRSGPDSDEILKVLREAGGAPDGTSAADDAAPDADGDGAGGEGEGGAQALQVFFVFFRFTRRSLVGMTPRRPWGNPVGHHQLRRSVGYRRCPRRCSSAGSC